MDNSSGNNDDYDSEEERIYHQNEVALKKSNIDDYVDVNQDLRDAKSLAEKSGNNEVLSEQEEEFLDHVCNTRFDSYDIYDTISTNIDREIAENLERIRILKEEIREHREALRDLNVDLSESDSDSDDDDDNN